MQPQSTTITYMLSRFGPLMSTDEVCEVLKYRTLSAFHMARSRGSFKVQPVRMPGRHAYFFSTREVAELLSNWKENSAQPEKEGREM
jgi:hypothetical protein